MIYDITKNLVKIHPIIIQISKTFVILLQVIVLTIFSQFKNMEEMKDYLMGKHRRIPIKMYIMVLLTSGSDEMGVEMMILEELKFETDILFRDPISQPKLHHNNFSSRSFYSIFSPWCLLLTLLRDLIKIKSLLRILVF